MAPSPDNDSTPKAPDKSKMETTNTTTTTTCLKETTTTSKGNDDQSLTAMNEHQLKDLLDEAVNYKNPTDREGKSPMFKQLLSEAEESIRNEMAAQAGGSELVRYCNPTAKRHNRHNKKQQSSIAKDAVHGGSLNNLTKEELFETSKHRIKKSVSARQREGGSLPCNVNAGIASTVEFLEEARKKKEATTKNFACNDLEAVGLLEHDCLAQDYQEQLPLAEIVHYPINQPAKYTSRATLQVNNVDDPIHLSHLETPTVVEKRKICMPTVITTSRLLDDGKKVDENGNALQQNNTSTLLKTKRKKILTDKNVVVCNSESVEGHRSDIIDDMDKLIEFIGGAKENNQSGGNGGGGGASCGGGGGGGSSASSNNNNNSKNRSNLKSKQLNRHTSDDSGKNSKKQRAHSTKSKENRTKLKKSNSLGEISTTSLDDFGFGGGGSGTGTSNSNDNNSSSSSSNSNTNSNNKDNKVVLRNNANKNIVEKPRERRSWGNMEPLPLQNLYSNASAENLETAEFRVVTKKKKSKKRRSSLIGRPKISSSSTSKSMHHHHHHHHHHHSNRSGSPNIRRKSACSVPHSEKSNDSSDVDSVHSLPIDTQRTIELDDSGCSSNLSMPISYADMARNSASEISSSSSSSVSRMKCMERKSEPATLVSATTVPATSNTSITTATMPPRTPAASTIIVPNSLPPQQCNTTTSCSIVATSLVTSLQSSVTSPVLISEMITRSHHQAATAAAPPPLLTNHNNNNICNINNNIYEATTTMTTTTTTTITNNNSAIIKENVKNLPPDVHNMKNFPAITKQSIVSVPNPCVVVQQQIVVVEKNRNNNINYNANSNNKNNNRCNISGGVTMTTVTSVAAAAATPISSTTTTTNVKNIKNTNHNVQKSIINVLEHHQNHQHHHHHNDVTGMNEQHHRTQSRYSASLPPDIPTVQTIEKMQLIGQGHPYDDVTGTPPAAAAAANHHHQQHHHHHSHHHNQQQHHQQQHHHHIHNQTTINKNTNNIIITNNNTTTTNNNRSNSKNTAATTVPPSPPQQQQQQQHYDDCSLDCDNSERTNNFTTDNRPPVVILSGLGSHKDVVPGLVFGFDINEQLLSEDGDDFNTATTTTNFNCDEFIARYRAPDTYTTLSHNHDKIVNFIGAAWEDCVMNISSGSVYYSEVQEKY